MNKNKWNAAVLSGIMLTLLLIFSCNDDLGDAEDPDTDSDIEVISTVAERPIISDLASRNYAQGDTPETLSVSVAPVSKGNVTYQWYANTTFSASGGTAIPAPDGKTNSYTPSTGTLGDAYYYVTVTNTDEEKDIKTAVRTSNVARIRVAATADIGTANAAVTVNTSTKYQYIRGFGAMSNFRDSPALSMDDIDKGYSEDGLGLNIFRIPIYPYMDDLFNGVEQTPAGDPGAHRNYYKMVRQARRHGALINASPWTPPAEWKSNNSRGGGAHLLPEYYANYANHLKNYIARMAANGAPIDVISIQNEPDIYVQYDGCDWTSEEMYNFVKQYARFIAPAGGPVKIMPGESYNFAANNSFYNPILNDAVTENKIDLIGSHMYGSKQNGVFQTGVINTINLAKSKNKEIWMTEYLLDTKNNYDIDSQWQMVWPMVKSVHDCMTADMNAYIWWYLKRFYSLIGDGQFGTLTGQPLFRGYALSHYAKYATGKTRVAATDDTGGVLITAYESNNEITLVMINEGGAVGQVNIAIPVAASGASMVITKGDSDTTNTNGQKMAPQLVVLSADKKTGVIDLPASSIISVRFSK